MSFTASFLGIEVYGVSIDYAPSLFYAGSR
jgi:hypothetical protein